MVAVVVVSEVAVVVVVVLMEVLHIFLGSLQKLVLIIV
jgi:hypothetical protein